MSGASGATRSNDGGRFTALDGLRGVAALVVVVHHALFAIPAAFDAYGDVAHAPAWVRGLGPLNLVWSGQEAVVLFFALSGFVLAVRYEHLTAREYPAYLAQRATRLWLPYAAVVLLSIALFALVGAHRVPQLSEWFHLMWFHPIGAGDLRDLALMRVAPTHNVDAAAWSLGVEMRLSIVLPLCLLAAWWVPLPALLAGSLVAALVLRSVALHTSMESDLLKTLYYAPPFVAGVAVGVGRDAVRRAVGRAPRPLVALALAGSAAALSWRWTLPLLWPHAPWGAMARTEYVAPAVGGLTLVALVVGRPAWFGWLGRPLARWLGRVSYSLYLVHAVVLLALVHTLGRVASPYLAVALMPPLALAVAEVVQRFVEVPSQQAARRVGRAVGGLSGRWRPRGEPALGEGAPG